PRAAPRGRSGVVPIVGACVGVAPLRASRRRCPCDLIAGKRCPLRAGRGWALPLRPGHGRASPFAGGRPCRGPGYSRPSPFLATFATKNASRTHRMILHDSISSHAV
ncbi:hypothetical protein B296_00033803, partial [Ensete ventricosum]